MALTTFQEEVLTGLLLGDGHLSIGGRAKNPRLRINRTDRDIDYAKWIADVFSPYTTDKSLTKTTHLDRRYGKTYGRVAFCTQRHPDFMEAYRRWYGTGVRRLPQMLTLSPVTVAVWLADDGSIYQKMKKGVRSGIELCFATASFGKSGSEKLAALLNGRYGGGFRVYGGYGDGTTPSRHFKIVTSTRPAKRLLRDIDPVFPPQAKAQFWRERINIAKTRPNCPVCGEDAVFRNGFYYGRGTTRLSQRLKCRLCSHKWREAISER